MKKYLISAVILVLAHGLIDKLYSYLYPNVSPVRAALIGSTSLLLFLAAYFLFKKKLPFHPLIGAASIYSSAIFGALLVQAGVLTSKSVSSVLAHVAILLVTYIILEFAVKIFRK